VAGGAVSRCWVASPVAEVTEDLGMLSIERPRMPGFRTDGCKGAKRHEGSPLGDRMANRAGSCENLARLTHVVAIVAPKTPRPVTMTYVMGVGIPLDLHGEENTSVEYRRDGVDGLVDLSFSISENLVEVLGVIPIDRLPYSLMGALLVIVFL
jgi:hypothetical protein